MTATIPAFALSDRLTKARKHARLSVAHMAIRFGVDRNTIGNYENGKTKPPFATVVVWSQATGVDLRWLAGGDYPSETIDLTLSDLRELQFRWTPDRPDDLWRTQKPSPIPMRIPA